MNTPVLEACAVSIERGGRQLLRGVDLAAYPGEKLAIVGPNGAGKTTLLRCLTGTWHPDAGAVRWGGQPLDNVSPRTLARHRAVVAQRSRLDFDFAVHEVVAMGRAPHGPQPDSDHQVDAALTTVGAQALRHRTWTHLSGGEQQRVALARAIVQLRASQTSAPRALLLDEPTNHLDPAWQLEALDVATTMASENIAVLAILHDLSLASAWADRIVVLHQGARVAAGTPAEVFQPALLAEIFRVEAAVVPHPRSGRPWVVPSHSLISPSNAPSPADPPSDPRS